MRRLPKTHKKLPMKKQDEPDFYKLDKTSPLPELEESQALNPNVLVLRRNPGGACSGGSSVLPMNMNSQALSQLNHLQGSMGNGMNGIVSLLGKDNSSLGDPNPKPQTPGILDGA